MTLACLLGPFVFELHFLLILKDPLLISEEMVLEHSVLRDPHLEFGFSEEKRDWVITGFLGLIAHSFLGST